MKKNFFLGAFLALIAFCGGGFRTLFAETQSIKMGGRLSTTFLMNGHIDLKKKDAKSDRSFFSQFNIYVDADLTDNTCCYVCLFGERDWDSIPNLPPRIMRSKAQADSNHIEGNPARFQNTASDSLNVKLHSCYIKFSELYSSPLTMTVGRQNIFWGSGLVLGDGSPDALAKSLMGPYGVADEVRQKGGAAGLDKSDHKTYSMIENASQLKNPYYSMDTAFDAFRLEYDLDLLKMDAVLAICSQNHYAGLENNPLKNDGNKAFLAGLKFDYMASEKMNVSTYLLYHKADCSEFVRNTVLTAIGRTDADETKDADETPAVTGPNPVAAVPGNTDGLDATPATADDNDGDMEMRVPNREKLVLGSDETDETSYSTLGFRSSGVLNMIDPNLEFEAELALQFGNDFCIRPNGANKFKSLKVDRKGVAAILGLTYCMPDNMFKPKFGLSYDYRSGDKNAKDHDKENDWDKKAKSWKAPYYGRTIGHLIDQLSNYAVTDLLTVSAPVDGTLAAPQEDMRSYYPACSSNISAITASFSMSPSQSLDLGLSCVFASLDKAINQTFSSQSGAKAKSFGKTLGVEWIGNVDYALSEDSRFLFQASYFDAGKGISIPTKYEIDTDDDGTNEEIATKALKAESAYEVMGSVVVDF